MHDCPREPAAMGLRERKRRTTAATLHYHATTLSAAHGFDQVTVEEICTLAEISPRTFFNYYDSKADAVLAPYLLRPTTALRELLSGGPQPALPAAVLTALYTPEPPHPTPPGTDWEQVRDLIRTTPALKLAAMAHHRTLFGTLTAELTTHLETTPGSRRLPDVPAAEEASLISDLLRDLVWFTLTTRDCTTPAEECDRALRRGALLTAYTQDLTW